MESWLRRAKEWCAQVQREWRSIQRQEPKLDVPWPGLADGGAVGLECPICDGSGLLTITEAISFDATGQATISDRPYVSFCHGCAAGQAWKEAGLE